MNENKQKALRFDLMVSIRYNSKRTRFFTRLNHLNSFLGVILGSSVVVSLLNEYTTISLISSVAVTLFSALALVLDFNGRAVAHQALVREFTALLNRLNKQEPLDEIECAIHQLDATEGEPLSTLYDICYNEQLQVEKLATEPIKIPLCRRLFAHYL